MIRQQSSRQQGLGIPSELGEKKKGEQERVGEGKMGKGNGRDKRGKRGRKREGRKELSSKESEMYTPWDKLTFELTSGLVSRLPVPCPESVAVNCIP